MNGHFRHTPTIGNCQSFWFVLLLNQIYLTTIYENTIYVVCISRGQVSYDKKFGWRAETTVIQKIVLFFRFYRAAWNADAVLR